MTEELRERALALAGDLLDRLAKGGIRDLEVRQDGIRVRVVAADGTAPAAPATQTVAAAATSPAPEVGRSSTAASVVVSPTAASAGAKVVTAPLTGIFYDAPSPQSPPFVKVGATIAAGEVVGLIEAMKLFNEIKSAVAGRVKRVIAENGKLVRAHAPLVELE